MVSKVNAIKLLFLLVVFVPVFTFAQQPVLTYNTPKVYNVGFPIDTLYPHNFAFPIVGSFYDVYIGTFGINDNFKNPGGLAIDGNGNLYLADAGNNRIEKITPQGVVSTLAGSGAAGNADGPATTASFNNPVWLAVDGSANVYVADAGNYSIRKILYDGSVITIAGNGRPGYVDGPAASASFTKPSYIAVDNSGNVYVNALDPGGAIRKIAGDGTVSTLATGISNPAGLMTDKLGNVYVGEHTLADLHFGVDIITPAGAVSNLFAFFGNVSPMGITMDRDGNFLLASGSIVYIDTKSHYSELGLGGAAATDVNGFLPVGSYNGATGIAADADNNIYFTDKGSLQLREVIEPPYAIVGKPLPAGLVLNTVTGAITGTPTAITPPTDYQVAGYNAFGGDTTTINIEVKLPVVFTFGPIPTKTVCDTDFTLQAATNTGSLFISSSNKSVADVIGTKVHITGPGTSIISVNNLGVEIKQTLTVNYPPTITFTGDVIVVNKVPQQLTPAITGNITGYTWYPSTGLNNTAIANPIANPLVTTVYHLQVETADGCGAVDSVTVKVAAAVIAPSAFTPNGDGINDVWNITSLDDFPTGTLNVYTRNGALVYHAIGYNKPWDGTYNGRQVPAGTYYYVIDLKNKSPLISGSVTIIR